MNKHTMHSCLCTHTHLLHAGTHTRNTHTSTIQYVSMHITCTHIDNMYMYIYRVFSNEDKDLIPLSLSIKIS